RSSLRWCSLLFFFQAEDGIRDATVTGVQTCALPISPRRDRGRRRLPAPPLLPLVEADRADARLADAAAHPDRGGPGQCVTGRLRSEERRVGKEGRPRRPPPDEKQSTQCTERQAE